GLVHGDPVARLSARRADPPARADLAREVRRLHDAPRSGADARPEDRRPRLAVRGGTPARRGHAPAHAPRRRPLREDAAEPERRAAASRRPLEVRLQGDQVDRQGPLHADAAIDDLERGRAWRVRLLREREPRRRSPALEPGVRAPRGRLPETPYAAV